MPAIKHALSCRCRRKRNVLAWEMSHIWQWACLR